MQKPIYPIFGVVGPRFTLSFNDDLTDGSLNAENPNSSVPVDMIKEWIPEREDTTFDSENQAGETQESSRKRKTMDVDEEMEDQRNESSNTSTVPRLYKKQNIERGQIPLILENEIAKQLDKRYDLRKREDRPSEPSGRYYESVIMSKTNPIETIAAGFNQNQEFLDTVELARLC